MKSCLIRIAEGKSLMYQKIFSFILSVILVVCCVGCSILIIGSFCGDSFLKEDSSVVEDGTFPLQNPTSHNYTMDVSYYYAEQNFRGQKCISPSLREKIEFYFESGTFSPAEPVVYESTNIPKTENDAKGISPLSVVLPDLDPAKYSEPYPSRSSDGLCEFETFYRIFAGMPTDEEIRIYYTDDQMIQKYETVNLGKYDELSDLESSIQKKSNTLSSTIHLALKTTSFFLSSDIVPEGTCALFTDSEGNMIIKTTANCWEVLEDDPNRPNMYYDICFYAKIS